MVHEIDPKALEHAEHEGGAPVEGCRYCPKPVKRHALCFSDLTAPRCRHGKVHGCDPSENPAHWVEVRVEPWVLEAVEFAVCGSPCAHNRCAGLREALAALKAAR